MADLFKTPPDVRSLASSEDHFRYFSPSHVPGSHPTTKRKRSAKNMQYHHGDKRRRRTADDFLMFCRIILEHENYDQIRSQDLRLRHSSSPLGSTGSSNESWPLSKDDYAEMYSPSRNDEDDDDANRNSTTEEERVSEEDDSWDQVTCYCGKPFAGRPMVECSKCLTWVHLKCAGLRRTHIPDTWHCAKCKTKSDIKVSGSRKRKSTKQVQHNKSTTNETPALTSKRIDVESLDES